MKIDRQEAQRIAGLAHLEFDDAGLGRMAAEMTRILEYVEQIAEIDLAALPDEGNEPAAHELRRDEVRLSIDRAGVEANAPAWDEGFFVVPKVIT